MTDIEKLFAATRYRVKKDSGVPKTCQTCKHWGNDIERKTEFLYVSTRKCEKIFKKITTSDPEIISYLPCSEYFKTDASFGCNGYEQDGNL